VSSQAIVFYDHDCGFCRWTLGLMLAWDRGHRLWPAPIEGPVGDRWLAGMPAAERAASWHIVEAGGVVSSAGRGIPAILEYVRGGPGLARLLRLAPAAVERAYWFVAGRRSRISRFVPRGWVRSATARVAAREREAAPDWALPPRERTAAG
jgi:predicted DCC family thiol-disulfide oxidoreductase YuxK